MHDAIREAARVLDLEDTEIREFECLGACDMAPMASVDGRYVGPLEISDAPDIVAALKQGRTVLPGRALEDEDYRLPWDVAGHGVSHPDVSPAGGTVKDRGEEGE